MVATFLIFLGLRFAPPSERLRRGFARFAPLFYWMGQRGQFAQKPRG
jgi:hypothetical protein